MIQAPDFFIIGAPKSATTTLWQYLSRHPNVFMPGLKEPHYFSFDLRFNRIKTEQQYMELFKEADMQDKIVGEASVYYLYSDTAVTNIENINHNAKYIVSVRNPVEMAVSLHAEQLGSIENIGDFRQAWASTEERRNGVNIPAFCDEPRLLLYDEICKVGSQLNRLLSIVERDRVKIVLFDDIKSMPAEVYRELTDFLELPACKIGEFTTHRQRKNWKYPVVARVLNQLGILKGKLGIKRSTGLLRPFYMANMSSKSNEIPMDVRLELSKYFADEIDILETIVCRDLSGWRLHN
jgi:Sulfotransferase domain